ncbi:DUF1080 domain-containing protein [Fulvivirgaceae bacterium PWU4]|uniref:DUF1080 domain-containing protein n=1 Tax=Chryseosolibacter histidini TaxID=2782349 RepID=A0AAP2DLW4_9BACT|nr:DUF1080 domain-containing protein [Chryseosolibacter histidini]MBT1696374.1 DUF1080 domain-containing protein [Chryseosolibacter histidini]
MKKALNRFFAVLCFMALTAIAHADRSLAADSLEGRWDLTIMMSGKKCPAWLEVRHSGHSTLVGHVVVVVGSARPISKITVNGNKFSFAIPPQWERGTGDMTFEGSFEGKGLSGSVVFPDGQSYTWTAVRAPSLRRQKEVAWGKPVALIPASGLKGWHALGENQWVVEQGILRSAKSGANLVTDNSYTDFKLHIEFRYPKGSNSGVYLRGRYEVQISDSQGLEPLPGELGGVYGFIAPSEQVAKAPGEWQTYDITLVGRMLTLVANGKTIISNQEIPGITGGALDSNEGEPGPIQLQGDHGPIEFRNIIITPAK